MNRKQAAQTIRTMKGTLTSQHSERGRADPVQLTVIVSFCRNLFP